MALLKLLRGLSSNLTTDKVPLNDGNLIVTTDNQKIYCDVLEDDEIKRIQLNKTLKTTYDDDEEELVFTKD